MDVTADMDTVTVTHERVPITAHARIWAGHLVVTDPVHGSARCAHHDSATASTGRNLIAHLDTGVLLSEAENVVLLAPTGDGKRTSPPL